MSTPAAEVEIREQLVRELLAEQLPDLADLPLTHLDSGWDNDLWRVGSVLLARLPRRAVAAELIVNEQRWLPRLAPRLPLPIPSPVRVGRPSPLYPWSWSIVPWLGGAPGDRAPITRPDDAADRLGRFLRALHHDSAPDAPHNPFRGVPLIARAEVFEERLAKLADHVDAAGLRRVWQAALAAEPHTRPPVWIHGDLHPANTLVAGGSVVAVIDFGDLCAGDPATDLAGAWMLLPASALPRFASAYGGVAPDLVRRSLGWATLIGLMLLDIGLSDGRPTYERVARLTLEQVSRAPT